MLSKGRGDIVTEADIAAEDAIRAELLQSFPDYPIVGEERGGQPPPSEKPYWLVDPLCGTRLFASGCPMYCSNIALVENGQITAAAIGEGTSPDVYLAEYGQGAWVDHGGITTNIRVDEKSTALWVDLGDRVKDLAPRKEHSAQFGSTFFRLALLANRWSIWMLPTTFSFVYLAKGSVGGVIHFRVGDPLHSAAGCLLASEAGATVTDLDGEQWSLESRSFIAAASHRLHRDLLALLDQARPTHSAKDGWTATGPRVRLVNSRSSLGPTQVWGSMD